MTKLVRGRIVIARLYTVEYAMCSDGTEPARDFLRGLKEGVLPDDPLTEEIPDEEQITDYARFLDLIRTVASAGEPTRSQQLNYLEDGLWEFKHGNKRIAFYDTGGTGTHTPKGKCSKGTSPDPDSRYWWFPELDPVLRLTNGWIKRGPKADPAMIAEAKRIRREDLARDRAVQRH